MTRCYVYLKNESSKIIKTVGTRGSDWDGDAEVTVNAKNGSFVRVEAMGCPSSSETDHWGWIYFKVYDGDDPDFSKYYYVFFRQADSGHLRELGADTAAMNKDDQRPGDLPSNRNHASGDPVSVSVPKIGTLYWAPDASKLGPTGANDSPIVQFTFDLKQR